MSSMFARGPKGTDSKVWQRGNGGGEGAPGEAGEGGREEGTKLEMSHINREPCMRSLLLVVETEARLFGEGWAEKTQQSKGV